MSDATKKTSSTNGVAIDASTAVLKEDSAALRQFVNALHQKVEALSRQELSQKQLAREALSILRTIIREESEPSLHQDVIPRLFDRLWQCPSMQRLFDDLYTRASVVLASTGGTPDFLDRLQVISELDELLSWYETRKSRLQELATFPSSKPDCIFGFHTVQDRILLDALGMEVRCALKLSHKKDQSLWLKARFTCFGKPVLAHQDWATWTDETDSFIRVVPGLTNTDDRGQTHEVSALLPILPESEHLIIDNISLFVPYAAFDLAPGKRELSIEFSLLDQVGRKIDLINDSVTLSSPQVSIVRSWPAPQALSLWSNNPVTGDKISQLHSNQSFLEQGHEVLNVHFDLDISKSRGSQLNVELQLMNLDGDLVPSAHESYTNPEGTFILRHKITANRCSMHLHEQTLSFPVDALMLADGTHQLLCKITVMDQSGIILCGSVAFVTLEMAFGGRSDPPTSLSPSIPVAHDKFSGLALEKFGVEPLSVLGEVNTARLWATLSSSQWIDRPCQVVFSIEQEHPQSHPELQKMRPLKRTYTCGGFPIAGRRQNLVVNFRWDEIAAALPRVVRNDRFIFRAQVYTIDGQLIFNRTRIATLPLQDIVNVAKQETLEFRSAYVADLRSKQISEGLGISSLVTITCDLAHLKGHSLSIYHEIVDQSGRSLNIGENQEALGAIMHFDFSASLDLIKSRAGCYQIQTEVQDPFDDAYIAKLKAGDYYLKIILFSESGTLQQTLLQPFRLHGRGLPESPFTIEFATDNSSQCEHIPSVINRSLLTLGKRLRSLFAS